MGYDTFKRVMGRAPRPIPYGTLIPETPRALPPDVLYHFWHPDREGIELCPADFARELATMHADLRICRPPHRAPTVSRPWLVWMKQPRITHPIAPGWQLLFCWQTRTTVAGVDTCTPLPLDNRIFANLYRISVQAFGSASKYFDSVVKELEGSKARAQAADKSRRDDIRHDYWQSTKIKNIGAGSKFARHHDGSIVPSRGEANWLADRGTRDLPSEVAREQRERPPRPRRPGR